MADTALATTYDAPAPVEAGDDKLLSIIQAAVMNPEIDADKIDRLLQMQERTEDRQAQRAYARAMVAAKSEIGPILKNQTNKQTSSRYADLARISAVVDPVATRHGLALSFSTEPSETPDHYNVVCTILHAAGHTEKLRLTVPKDGTGIKGNANKTDTHALGSSMSYARRYLKCMAFDIATTDDDGNNASRPRPIEYINDLQVAELQHIIETNEIDKDKFLAAYNLSDLSDIQASKFEGAKNALLKKAAQS